MIKFFHTADIHLGVENYGKIDPKTGMHTRLLDFKHSLEECIDLAIKEKIDFFLFCGDAYKTAFPTPTQQKILTQLFFKLRQADIPVVIVVGNHDHPLSFGKVNSLDIFKDLPLDGFHVFSKPDILKLETKNGPIQIVGVPWPTRNNLVSDKKHFLKDSAQITAFISQAVSQIIKTLAEKLDTKIPAIFAGHLTVGSGVFSGSEKCAIFGNDPIFLPSQLALEQFDYVALGHLHRFQNLNVSSYPAIIYPGSIERIDFGERKEEKGFCSVSIKSDEIKPRCNFEFIPVKTRPMVQVEVFLQDWLDQTQQIIDELEKYEVYDSIIKIIYHIPDGKQDKVDIQQIQAACSGAICIASIIPVRKLAVKEKRATLKVDMSVNTLLEKYFESKNYSEEKKLNLLLKTQYILEKNNQKEQ